ncbi:MAG: DNA gyrase modulator, partial [Thermoplasmata archaeon]
MEDLLRTALGVAEASGVLYADARLISPQRYVHLAVRNGAASALTDARRAGLGVRVRTDRAWGFAATSELSVPTARSTARFAVRLARAAGRTAPECLRVTDDPTPRDGRYATVVRRDPFDVPREEVLSLLKDAEARVHVGAEVKSGLASFQAWEEA